MLALKGWNTSKSRQTQTTLLPAKSLKLTAVSSLSGSRGLRSMAALMLFGIESRSSSQRPKSIDEANFERIDSFAPARVGLWLAHLCRTGSRGLYSECLPPTPPVAYLFFVIP